MKEFNVAGACFTPTYARMALADALREGFEPRACHWMMSPVQKVMVENCAVAVTIVEKVSQDMLKKDESEVALSHSMDFTLCGINVLVERDAPIDTIELRYGREVIGRITNLTIPRDYVP
jgi:hypothetical protein